MLIACKFILFYFTCTAGFIQTVEQDSKATKFAQITVREI